MYPDAPIYTLFYNPAGLPASITRRRVVVPFWTRWLSGFRKLLLPFLPSLIESLDLSEYDLVVSSSSCVAKGVIVRPDARHICYLHSPMRYIWDQRHQYLKVAQGIPGLNLLANMVGSNLRIWDVTSSARVDQFVANSSFVAERVRSYYRRDAVVVHPPVGGTEGIAGDSPKDPFFLVAGALVSYKRFDMAIRACELSGVRLVVAGSGPFESSLRRLASNHVSFEIAPSSERLMTIMSQATALLHPGIEDFGILPVEAMGCGLPVIAYGQGGALDYVKPGVTGELFYNHTPEALAEVIGQFSKSNYRPEDLREMNSGFSLEAFQNKMRAITAKVMEGVSL